MSNELPLLHQRLLDILVFADIKYTDILDLLRRVMENIKHNDSLMSFYSYCTAIFGDYQQTVTQFLIADILDQKMRLFYCKCKKNWCTVITIISMHFPPSKLHQ